MKKFFCIFFLAFTVLFFANNAMAAGIVPTVKEETIKFYFNTNVKKSDLGELQIFCPDLDNRDIRINVEGLKYTWWYCNYDPYMNANVVWQENVLVNGVTKNVASLKIKIENYGNKEVEIGFLILRETVDIMVPAGVLQSTGNQKPVFSSFSVPNLNEEIKNYYYSNDNSMGNPVYLYWTIPDDHRLRRVVYNIYRDDVLVGTSQKYNFIDRINVADKSYSYRVSASDAYGNTTNKSSAVSYTAPKDVSLPEKPIIESDNTGDLIVKNLKDSWGVAGYKVYVNNKMVATNYITDENRKTGSHNLGVNYPANKDLYYSNGNEPIDIYVVAFDFNGNETQSNVFRYTKVNNFISSDLTKLENQHFSTFLDYGGMWSDGPGMKTNPATGGSSCPTGYTKVQVFGRSGGYKQAGDTNVYLCYRQHLEGRDSLYDFGGMYEGNIDGSLTPNKCPASYLSQKILGEEGVDDPLYVCYRPHSTSGKLYEFGGMYNESVGFFIVNPVFTNVLTGSNSCPASYIKYKNIGRTYGYSKTFYHDYSFYYCMRDIGFGIKEVSGFKVTTDSVKNTAKISWTKFNQQELEYNSLCSIYRNEVEINSKLCSQNEFIDYTLKANKKYTYTLRIINRENKSIIAKSPNVDINIYSADIQPPSVPVRISGRTITPLALQWTGLDWKESTDNDSVKGYNIYRDNVLIGYSNRNGYNDSSGNIGVTYTYNISAIDKSGNESEKSESLVFKTGGNSLTQVTTPQTPSDPVATITIDGLHDKTYTIGEPLYTYSWSSTGADTYSSSYTSNDPKRCGSGSFVANNSSGTYKRLGVSSNLIGCVYTITYTAKDSKTGKSASSTLILRIVGPTINTTSNQTNTTTNTSTNNTNPTNTTSNQTNTTSDSSGSTNTTTNVVVPTTIPDPTATLTIDGLHEKTFVTGNTPYTYAWSAKDADTFSSVSSSNNPTKCGASNNWIANNSNGSYYRTTISSNLAGCVYTVVYTVKNSKTGKVASDTVIVKVVAPITNTSTGSTNTNTSGSGSTNTNTSGSGSSNCVGTICDQINYLPQQKDSKLALVFQAIMSLFKAE